MSRQWETPSLGLSSVSGKAFFGRADVLVADWLGLCEENGEIEKVLI
jgi:hypothetical protein